MYASVLLVDLFCVGGVKFLKRLIAELHFLEVESVFSCPLCNFVVDAIFAVLLSRRLGWRFAFFLHESSIDALLCDGH